MYALARGVDAVGELPKRLTILGLSKVEAGNMDISPERFRLRRLLDYLEAAFRPLSSHKGLEFRVVTAPGVPSELVTDESRLRQVLRNPLSNAVKFTEAGHVELRIEPVDRAAAGLPDSVRRGSPALAFRVSDTGIGISDQHLENIFGAFQQADGTTSRKYGGTGLGLSMCRKIAYLLGGSIHAQSTQDEGSCFTLYLPTVHPAVQDTAAPGSRRSPCGGRARRRATRPPRHRTRQPGTPRRSRPRCGHPRRATRRAPRAGRRGQPTRAAVPADRECRRRPARGPHARPGGHSRRSRGGGCLHAFTAVLGVEDAQA